jgi:hypothetical protein
VIHLTVGCRLLTTTYLRDGHVRWSSLSRGWWGYGVSYPLAEWETAALTPDRQSRPTGVSDVSPFGTESGSEGEFVTDVSGVGPDEGLETLSAVQPEDDP